ncbi:MAG TPA: carboxypeptidase-like regulatory domain-containing protein [Terriglobia bacterium]|nr:carboxypeptidase-like regulatory domain-containing protein [Terriglobia bacterium]
MKKLFASGVFFALLCMVGFAPTQLWGQAGGSGTVSGSVTDQSGGIIAGAEVTLTDTATKTYHTAPSNSAGRYFFNDVQPGFYDIKVQMKGFRQSSVTGQQVVVGQDLTVNVTLEVGAATQTVEVKATPGAELQTMNATMGTTVGGAALLTMPSVTRDATSVMMFQPMTAPTFGGAEGNVTGGQVAGAMSDQNTFTLDGGQATDDLAGDNNYTAGNRGYVGPQAAIPTPVESIEEFKVATNNQTADFSESSGGQIMLVTKRGTTQFHGSAYDYFRDQLMDSAGFGLDVVGAHKVKYHQNRFGGSLGGPMLPGEFLGGKTFIYGNYEGFRYPYANGRFERLVPSDLLRQGILQFRDATGAVVQYNLKTSMACGPSGTAACDPRGIGINPVISKMWNTYEPEPNDCAGDGDHLNTCGYFGALKLNQKNDFAVVRIDHDFGAKWRLMGSYRYYKLVLPSTNQVDIGGLLPGDTKGTLASASSNPQQPRYIVAGLTGTLTPTLTNQFTLSYLRNDWNWIRAGVPNGQLGIPGGLEIGGETTNPLGPMNFDTQDARFRTWNGHDWAYIDTLSYLKGNHFLQFGGDIRHWWDDHVRDDNVTGALSYLVYQINKGTGLQMTGAYRPMPCGAAVTTNCLPASQNSAWQNLYTESLGFVGTASQLIVRGGSNFTATGASYLEDHSITDAYSMFVTDSWKIRPNLTLNYGLEWGVQLPPFEQNGVQDILTDASGNAVPFQSYLDNTESRALAGQVYNPVLGFTPIHGIGGHPKYPYAPFYGAFSPRVSLAWSPTYSDGILGKIFGNRKSVIRGGYSRINDRTNAVNNVLTPLLGYGFGQPVRCNGGRMDGVCTNKVNGTNPTNGFRIGVDGNTAPFPAITQTLPVPAEPGVNTPAASVLFGLDTSYRPGLDDQIDFSIQRELPGQMILEVGYNGRWAKHLYVGTDTNVVPTMFTLGGQTYAQAFHNLYVADATGKAPAAQPFFETALAGSAYCQGYANCTSAVLANEGAAGNGNLSTFNNPFGLFSDVDGNWNFPGCAGCSILPTDTQGYAGLNVATTSGFSNYQAGFATLQKRTGHGLTVSANLTWSHSLNTVGINQEYVEDAPNNMFNLRSDYAPAPWDRTWALNALSNYELPFGKGKRFATNNSIVDRVIGGWSFAPIFTWATGLPIETYSGSNSCQELGGGYLSWCSGAQPLVNTSVFGHSSNMNVHTNGGIVGINNDPYNDCGGQSCNPGGYGGNLFANPTAVYNDYRRTELGLDTRSLPSGPYHGQARWNLDFTIAKTTKITERVGTTFYAQFLNAFNHMMWGDPGMNLDDPNNFGTLTGQYGSPRTIELGLRVAF